AVSKFLSEVFQSPDPARDGRTITVAETLDKAAMAEAISQETESLQLKRKYLPPGDVSLLESLDNLAACYEQAGRKADAEPLRRELAELKAKAAKPAPGNPQSPSKPPGP